MRYSLRQLEVFVATVQHGSLSAAAKELALSQSAASSALIELEKQFDMRLFERIGKRLVLSELGRQLHPQARALLEQARVFEHALGGGRVAGTLAVGATLTIGNYLAVPMMADFRAHNPDVEVSLDVANTATIVAKVANYELDVGMIEGELSHRELDIMPWREDELVVFAAPDHPFAHRKKPPALKQLLAQNWVLREPGSGTRQTFERAMHDVLAKLHIALELQHTEAIKRAVEAGMGLGCLSQITLKEAFARGSLVPVDLPGRDFQRRFSLIVHRKKHRGPLLKQWLTLCEDSV
ncbi:MAG: LysR family transcriptional regulator [Gammaproteobacteria bacterium]|nr:MAG: LysR family transcriptional regulator [Gammaproteobacteria bacterium]PIE37552.1 MAG: LysR family transcriptional regulator [Gammaproteobacteria bacterium]